MHLETLGRILVGNAGHLLAVIRHDDFAIIAPRRFRGRARPVGKARYQLGHGARDGFSEDRPMW